MTWITAIIEIVVFFVGFLVALGAVAFVCLRQYYLARRKGYSPIAAGAVVGGAVIGVIIFALVASVLLDDRAWSNAQKNAFVLLVLAVAPLLAVVALVAVLPRRYARHAGARSSRFLWSKTARRLERGLYWTGVLIATTGFLGLWFVDARTAIKMISLGFSVLVVGPPLFTYFRKRAVAPTLQTVLRADPRPPVLYLRAFYEESEPFTWGPKDELARYTAAPITAETSQIISVTFEQYLASTLSQQIGPFVALGNPEDVLAPEGAARDYAEDRDWQQHFLQLAADARVIVMEVSQSENLRWEIASILRNGWQCKFFVVTPPAPKANQTMYRWVLGALRAAKGIAPLRWSEFASQLVKAGFRIDLADPGAGSVVSFDLAGSTEVLVRGAADPGEFVTAIRRRLEALSLTHGSTQSSHDAVPHQHEPTGPNSTLHADAPNAARR